MIDLPAWPFGAARPDPDGRDGANIVYLRQGYRPSPFAVVATPPRGATPANRETGQQVTAAERILERKPVSLVERLVANDDRQLLRDRALGGLPGLIIMYAVAVLFGVLLATGGVL